MPIITVDGPSGSGKGTLSHRIAKVLGWHFLDSGALYRVLAFAALKQHIPLEDIVNLEKLATQLAVVFKNGEKIFLEEEEITLAIRTEEIGNAASKVALITQVRAALLERQRAFLNPPGLVADGRDMGTVVFPKAELKIFLEASVEERAKRRQSQLKAIGIDVSLDGLLAEIAMRDNRDRQRVIAPLIAAHDAIVVDTTAMSIDEVFETVMQMAKNRALV